MDISIIALRPLQTLASINLAFNIYFTIAIIAIIIILIILLRRRR